jgi:hypothetical protein
MENYEKLIMELLQGETPKQKYEHLQKLIDSWRKAIAENAINKIKENPLYTESEKAGSIRYVESISSSQNYSDRLSESRCSLD